MHYLPPYISKMVQLYEKEVRKAEKEELRAKKRYEFQQDYTKICREKLENAKKQEQDK